MSAPGGLEEHPRLAVLALSVAPGLAMAGDPAGWPALLALVLGASVVALRRGRRKSPMG